MSVPGGTIDPVSVTLSYAVLYVSDLDASARFYRALGLDLLAEQHGGGPIHYSCDLAGTVLELYPAGTRPPTRTRLGLRVPGAERTAPLRDPDGNVVEVQAP